jgi:tetratricopeptide (TPR) repeat protein/serine/threonine protein kinase
MREMGPTRPPRSSREIFIAAVKLPAEEWDMFLTEACGEDDELRRCVEDLLDAHRKAGSFLGDTAPPVALTADAAVTESPGSIVGPYRLLEEIGEGGMGLVFVAEQERPVRRKVALKVIKPGMDTRQVIARFEAERQALALMDHPNIARVLDAGATESGRPFFVMELIQGVPITLYCDECEMTTRDRLGLFIQVCRGVQHAHQKGIIHRDVKPTNVLVTMQDGRPAAKVIDFGVAKAINQRLTERTIMTGFAQMVGTPLYMSPEQAEMSALALDTRTDIYSLGVLLYELLTGTTPFEGRQLGEAAFEEVRRVIRDVEPPTPSARISTLGERAGPIAERRRTDPRRHCHEVRGDLDWIAMRALEKDRSRRYETASAFAADIERYLKDEPVEACPPSRAYRLRKLIRRNRRSIAVAACLVAAFLVLAGSIGWIARDRASRRIVLEREVTDAIEETASSYRRGRMTDAMASAKRAEGLLSNGIGSADLSRQVRRWRADLDTVVRLEEIRSDLVREKDGALDWTSADDAYEALLEGHGLGSETLEADRAAERIRTSPIREDLLAGIDHWVLARYHTQRPGRERLLDIARRADADPWRNRLRESLVAPDRETLLALARDESLLSQPPADIQLLGRALREMDQIPASVEALRRAQAERPADFWINVNLGVYLEDSDPPRAIAFYRAALAVRPTSFAAYLGLGNSLVAKGDFEEAIAAYRRAIVLHPAEAKLRLNLGVALGKIGRDEEEIVEIRRGLELWPESMEGHFNLAQILAKQGKRDEAIPEYRRVLELRPSVYRAHEQLGNLFRDQGKIDEAIAEWRKAIQIRPDRADAHIGITEALWQKGDLDGACAESQKAVEADPQNAKAHYNLGVALAGKGRLDEAMASYSKAIELNPKDASALANLATLLHHQGKTDEGVGVLQKAVEADPAHFNAHFNLGSLLANQGKFDGAADAYRRALELDPASFDTRQCLGIVFGKQGKGAEAIAELRAAMELRPNEASVHANLGSALKVEGRLDEAIVEYRKAIELQPEDAQPHASLAGALLENGELAAALLSFRRCHDLGSRAPGWQFPSAEWIADCEKLIELEGRLPRVLAGEEVPGDGKERLAFADLAYRTRRFELAARFFEEALASEPGLETHPPGVHRYNAACAAALAGAGQGRDASSVDEAARERRRAQALGWLRGELEQAAGLAGTPATRAGVARALRHWLHDPDLKSLRDGASLAGLPPEERQAFEELWSNVGDLLRGVEKEKP